MTMMDRVKVKLSYKGYQQQMPRNQLLSEGGQTDAGDARSLFPPEDVSYQRLAAAKTVDYRDGKRLLLTHLLVIKEPAIKHNGLVLHPLLNTIAVHLYQV